MKLVAFRAILNCYKYLSDSSYHIIKVSYLLVESVAASRVVIRARSFTFRAGVRVTISSVVVVGVTISLGVGSLISWIRHRRLQSFLRKKISFNLNGAQRRFVQQAAEFLNSLRDNINGEITSL